MLSAKTSKGLRKNNSGQALVFCPKAKAVLRLATDVEKVISMKLKRLA